jgi:hypothetical protein
MIISDEKKGWLRNFLYIILILWNLQVKTSVVIQKIMLTNVLEFISNMKCTNQMIFRAEIACCIRFA